MTVWLTYSYNSTLTLILVFSMISYKFSKLRIYTVMQHFKNILHNIHLTCVILHYNIANVNSER